MLKEIPVQQEVIQTINDSIEAEKKMVANLQPSLWINEVIFFNESIFNILLNRIISVKHDICTLIL
tara:strand:- start:935 stop:1132 length:198 start_codon:yes stop_codon:yes gene_type:complete